MVPKDAPQRPDHLRQAVIGDDGVRPHRPHEFFLGHHPIAMPEEDHQDVEDFARQVQAFSVLPAFACRDVHAEPVEDVNLLARIAGWALHLGIGWHLIWCVLGGSSPRTGAYNTPPSRDVVPVSSARPRGLPTPDFSPVSRVCHWFQRYSVRIQPLLGSSQNEIMAMLSAWC
jgi:hypothetical protein